MVIQDIPQSEKLVIRGDFNRHIGTEAGGYDTVHRGFGTERETMEEFLFWTLRWPMNCW